VATDEQTWKLALRSLAEDSGDFLKHAAGVYYPFIPVSVTPCRK
jgi:hypothetical protein